MAETLIPLAERAELTVADVLDETFPGIVDWCDPVWLGYWGLDAYRGAPARRTDDDAMTPEEVASIVASGRAITTVPEIVAVPFAHLGVQGDSAHDAQPAGARVGVAEGAATPAGARRWWNSRGQASSVGSESTVRFAREKRPLTFR